MSALDNIVTHYLSEFHAGRREDAFHSLIESDSSIISDLICAYEDAADIDTKVFVIEVISEFRLDSSLCFLRHALRRDEPRVWKAALNGMAMTDSLEAVDAMNHVHSSIQDPNKREWIKEAIADTNHSITTKGEQVGMRRRK